MPRLADVVWNLFRYRRIKAAYLAAKISQAANEEASRLAEAAMRTMKDSDEDQIHQFLACDPRWNPAAAYPRAHQIYQERLAEAKSGLNMDIIQGNVTLSYLLDVFERIEALILSEKRRLDEIMRELDRHRFMQSQIVRSVAGESQAQKIRIENDCRQARRSTNRMTSERKAQANRANARKSTGPKRRVAKRVQRVMRAGLGLVYPSLPILSFQPSRRDHSRNCWQCQGRE